MVQSRFKHSLKAKGNLLTSLLYYPSPTVCSTWPDCCERAHQNKIPETLHTKQFSAFLSFGLVHTLLGLEKVCLKGVIAFKIEHVSRQGILEMCI